MAYDGWVQFAGTDLINLARTVALSETLGIDTVWVLPETIDFIEGDLGETGYNDIAQAPWYDPGAPASSEFAGLVPLAIAGLDDSTFSRSVVEFITDGGQIGRGRSSSLSLVFNVAVVASTERGAEFGLRWMSRRLRDSDASTCSGSDLRYFRYAKGGAPIVHRRNVGLTRAPSVTRKRVTDCSSTWLTTFTMTAGDSYEYGEPIPAITSLGDDAGATGPLVTGSGSLVLSEEPCAGVNYAPVYDPLAPALIAPPAPPNLLPANWDLVAGSTFQRYWARVSAPEPSDFNVVPVLSLSTTTDARMVRVAVWPDASETDDRCDPLFAAVLTYLPSSTTGELILDGEQRVVYFWDGISPMVRRADTLAYSMVGGPVEWAAFNDSVGFLVTLDLFTDSDGIEGAGDVRVALDLVPKSD